MSTEIRATVQMVTGETVVRTFPTAGEAEEWVDSVDAAEADIRAVAPTTKSAWELRAGDVTKFGTVRSTSPIGTSWRLVQFTDMSTKRMRSGTQVTVR